MYISAITIIYITRKKAKIILTKMATMIKNKKMQMGKGNLYSGRIEA